MLNRLAFSIIVLSVVVKAGWNEPFYSVYLKMLNSLVIQTDNFYYYDVKDSRSSTAMTYADSRATFPLPGYSVNYNHSFDAGHIRPLFGFEYCSELDGSFFDFAVALERNGSVVHLSSSLIDNEARGLALELVKNYRIDRYLMTDMRDDNRSDMVLIEHAKRFSCFLAADGNNDFVRIVKDSYRKVLRFVEGSTYTNVPFEKLSKANVVRDLRFLKNFDFLMMDRELPVPVQKRDIFDNDVSKSRIAYLLLVHSSFENLMVLLGTISDPDTVILIHVDKKSSDLRDRVAKWLFKREAQIPGHSKKIALTKTSFACYWGHSSLVEATAAGYFELLDFSDNWEYVINLSETDMTLHSNLHIYRILKQSPPYSNFIHVFHSPFGLSRLSSSPSMLNEHGFIGKIHRVDPVTGKAEQDRYLAFPYNQFHITSQNQWMILHRTFVRYIRSSPIAMHMLAYAQFHEIPDESYFSLIAENSPFSQTLHRHSLRFQNFVGSHPRELTMEDVDNILASKQDGKLFARKIQLAKESCLVSSIITAYS
eukprot:Partr_v1_DN25601_c0_g1_i2_m4592